MRSPLAPLLAVAAGLLCSAPLPAAAAEDEAAKAPDIRGSYQIVGGEKYGEKIPDERLKDNRVVITEKTFAVVDRDSKKLYSSTYTLAPAEDLKLKKADGVWFVDLVSQLPQEGAKAPGLIRVRMKKAKDGAAPEVASVAIIYSLSDARPERFKTGPKDLLFRLKKTAAPAGQGGDEAAAE